MKEQEIVDLVGTWQHRLGLDQWEIKVPFGEDLEKYWADNDNPNAHASVERSKVYDSAKIYFNPRDYAGWTEQDATIHVVHELVHVLFRDVEWTVDQIVGQVPRDAEDFMGETFQHHLEGCIDRLARRFVNLARVEDERI